MLSGEVASRLLLERVYSFCHNISISMKAAVENSATAERTMIASRTGTVLTKWRGRELEGYYTGRQV